jgi:hypothetical protein
MWSAKGWGSLGRSSYPIGHSDNAAWASYKPSLTLPSGAGSITETCKEIGTTVFCQIQIQITTEVTSAGTPTAPAIIITSLPEVPNGLYTFTGWNLARSMPLLGVANNSLTLNGI